MQIINIMITTSAGTMRAFWFEGRHGISYSVWIDSTREAHIRRLPSQYPAEADAQI
jgi:hypothetical protein